MSQQNSLTKYREKIQAFIKSREAVDMSVDDDRPNCCRAANQSADMARDLIRALEVIEELTSKMNVVHNSLEYQGVWQVNQIHVGPYTGPRYEGEFHRALQFLSSLSAEEGVNEKT